MSAVNPGAAVAAPVLSRREPRPRRALPFSWVTLAALLVSLFALLPLGFVLLGMQAISELIKRVAFLKGLVPDPTQKGQAKSAEEELADFLKQKEVSAREQAALRGRP